jgi:hypothetical protein
LRELQALSEIEQEDWSRVMQTLLRRACHVEHLCRDKQQAPDQRLIDLISRRYDTIVACRRAGSMPENSKLVTCWDPVATGISF